MSPDALIWTGAVLGLLALLILTRSLWRLRRARRGLTSEERRLRDDPRFAEMWVKQYRPMHEESSVPKRDDADAAEDDSPQSRPGIG